jgi:twitching motility two-component system response regulator PilH
MARILLIDDRHAGFDRARTLLEAEGHELIEATDAIAGLHRAAEDAPDCILVELGLHGLDGLVISRQICAAKATRRIPVIVWGTVEAASIRRLVAAAGAFAYVDRVRAPSALRGTVRRALSARSELTPASRPSRNPIRGTSPR